MATMVLEMELTEGIRALTVDPKYRNCRILIRHRKYPLGWVQLSVKNKNTITPEELSEAIKRKLGWELVSRFLHIGNENSFGSEVFAPVSVVVCTRNRTHSLSLCLKALLQLEYPAYEIIVVDNAPANDDTKNLVKDLPVRYVREERPGLDRARNRGIKEASHEIIAFTDDDSIVDAFWLHAVNYAFRNASIMAVSGMVAPAEMETPAQHMFELGYGGMGLGFTKRYISREKMSNRQLLWASSFGTGANMAFRKTVFDQIGGFDVAFDVGTPTRGGGDVEMFFRLVNKGYTMAYDPAMLIWHTHQKGMNSLFKQMQDKGKGTGCFLLHVFRYRTVRRSAIIRFFWVDWLWRWNLKNLLRKQKHISRKLSLFELRGMVASPFAYWNSQKIAKRTVTTLKAAE